MSDRLEAFEIEPSYDRGDPFPRGPRILWGRVAALSAGLIFFFLIGRITAGGGSSADVTRLQNQHSQDLQTISQLQASLAAIQATQSAPAPGIGQGGTPSTPAPTTSASAAPTTAPGGATASPGAATTKTYIVKAGDTLSSIEAKFYGRTGHDLTTLIMQANQLTSAAAITPNQKLIIPPLPAGGTTATATTAPSSTSSPSSPSPRASVSPTH
jgi:LysM repeat protein